MADPMSNEPIEAAASKLNEFASGLSEHEREALVWLIAHAEPEEEMTGYIDTLSARGQGPAPRVTGRRPKGPGTDRQGSSRA